MEKKYGYIVKVLGLVFVIISIIHIFYASCSQRGLYLDGSVFFMQMLDDISNNNFRIISDSNHVRFFINALQELPFLLCGFVLHLKNKLALANIYSLTQFFVPFLLLWWNYSLTKRTKQYAVLFWSIFVYAAVILQYEIFVMTETIIGIPAQFVLLNYMLGKVDYTKADKIGIFFLVLFMFGTYEQTMLIGLIIFACLFPALYDEENPKNVSTKIFIGVGSLISAIYCFVFAFFNNKEQSDFIRFLGEATDFWFRSFGLCMVIALLSVIVFVLVYIGRKKFTVKLTAAVSFLYLYFFLRMVLMPQIYLYPMWEGHIRSVVCWLEPAIFLGICLYRYFGKDDKFEFIKTAYVPTLLCGITLSAWQMVHTYYWNVNIEYMKKSLANCDKILYIPEEYDAKDEISSFHNRNLRRYIWLANYASTALCLDSDYKIKHFLVHYANSDDINPSLREYLYVVPEDKQISIPYNMERVNIKNKFWDLTDCAEALHRYNKDNNVKTDG